MNPARSLAVRAAIAVLLMVGFYVLSLSVAGLLVWLPWAAAARLRTFPIRLMVFCLIGAFIILKSVVPRPDRFVPPGPRLSPESHPRLFAEIGRTAESAGQLMPSDVYLVPDVNAWVSQRGGFLGFGGRRVMGIGLTLLQALKVPEFRAVIAHEFGHYHGGDVKLGPLIYRTREALVRTVVGLAQHSGLLTRPFDWYARLFFRVSHAVSRHQEREADVLAAGVAGPAALARGLVSTHRAALAFHAYWLNEVAPVLEAGFSPPLGQGFARFCEAPSVATSLVHATEKAMQQGEADPYDTHPSLHERLAALGQNEPEPSPPSDPPALTLLDSLPELEGQLLAGLVQGKPLRPLPWDDIGSAVLLPRWKAFLREHGSGLRGVTPASIPRLDWTDLGGALARSMKQEATGGGEERIAEFAVGAAVAILLAEKGFALEAPPGASPVLKRDDLRMEPFVLRARLAGDDGADEWRRLCAETAIGDVDMGGRFGN